MSHQRANVVIIWWRRWLRPKGATRSLNSRGIERVSEGVRGPQTMVGRVVMGAEQMLGLERDLAHSLFLSLMSARYRVINLADLLRVINRRQVGIASCGGPL